MPLGIYAVCLLNPLPSQLAALVAGRFGGWLLWWLAASVAGCFSGWLAASVAGRFSGWPAASVAGRFGGWPLRLVLFCLFLQLSVLPQWASATTAGTFRDVWYCGTQGCG